MRGRVARNGDTQASLGNVANIVTIARILMAPVFIWLLLADAGELGVLRWVAAGLFVFAIVTDSVDGLLARRQNLVTDFGKLVDPIADKVLIGGALVALVILRELPWWVAALILVREIGITVFRFIALRDRVIAASVWGKLKTVVQAVAISLALFPFALLLGSWVDIANLVLMSLAVVLTVGSGIEYLVAAARAGRSRA
ncbi:CDP-diacylglycerol--glycerol-3-phosphate 3-phosphatidyltransferase [Homoserinibacter sp. YIM 151385]|uniref:CDP-diacylglycerol--glycerol-3-phosphate 3-phosphatidyltransferase n=1 Tax=Homoserinibacter sp. YIM 151385 TaxID=2985506 RepID=UPI0022F01CD8|nr:CDP-diacylglycerol--glycerol-3-phosphate 3-phosphatidyltransferase [Homoserinibacter sp. YIM 151385]WBU39352.1 CDP-diacylglycerol--glycerol-3-phosphate 3-phosphatidyltransferase [Homoserinibacter sp. YIM 151385]